MTSAARSLLRHVWSHPANAGARGRAIVRVLAWQCWSRTIRTPWTVELGWTGQHLRCYPRSSQASAVLYTRLPDWREMCFLLDWLLPGDTFVDVGANIGVYTLLACSSPGVEVWSFEPSYATFLRLAENVSLNPFGDVVHLERLAVGAKARQGFLTTGRDTRNRLVPYRPGTEPVRVVTLDDHLERRASVAAVKVDVEGDEVAVLDGAQQVLRRCHPVVLVEGNDVAGLRSVLDPHGYVLCTYDPGAHRLREATPEPGGNVIAVADLGSANLRLHARDAR